MSIGARYTHIYTSGYITDRPPLDQLTDSAVQSLLKSSIIRCINLLAVVTIGSYDRDGIYIHDGTVYSDNSCHCHNEECIRSREITFYNFRDINNISTVSIHFDYYDDRTFGCKVFLGSDLLDETCLDSTIASLILPRNKSAKAQ